MDLSFAQWTETKTEFGEHSGTRRTTHWVRLDPPAYAWRNEHRKGWSHHVVDERGHLYTASRWTNCSLSPSPVPITSEGLIPNFLAPVVPEKPALEGSPGTLRVRSVILEGSEVQHYEWERIQGNFRVQYQIWAEPKSRRLIRREIREWNLLTGEETSHELHDNYIYNREPPPDVFRMPPDRPIEEVSPGSTMPEVWSNLPDSDRSEIQSLIAQSDKGWREGDFAVFSSAWQFGGAAIVPTEQEWKTRIESQRGIWSEWQQVVTRAYLVSGITVQTGQLSSLMHNDGTATLWVRTRLRVIMSENNRRWEGEGEVCVQGEAGTRRIVHWEVSLMEMLAALRK